MTVRLPLTVLMAALLASGCASVAIDDNLNATHDFARDRLKVEPRWIASEEARRSATEEVDRLLAKPLGADDAVGIGLRYSPNYQRLIAESAANSASATQSGRLSNPIFSFEKLARNESGVRELEISRMISFSLIDLLTLPTRAGIAKEQQQRLRYRAAGDVVQTATEARQAWINAVAAQQIANYSEQVMRSAQIGAELARRLKVAGNYSRLQQAREQAFYADAAAELARARQRAVDARETLVRTLGLNETQAAKLTLPDRLPDIPKEAPDESSTTQTALDQRIDVQLAKLNLNALARTQGLTRIESIANGLTVGLANNSETGKTQQRGFQLEVPLPIFDFGDASRSEAQARYMAAFYRTAQTAVEASSQVRQSYSNWRTAYDLARHYRDEVVPLRKTISDEVQLQYNGMFISVFELLADAREQISSVMGAIQAQRDFWLADAAFKATTLGKPINAAAMTASDD